MKKYFTPESIIGISLIIFAILYLVAHRFVPSSISRGTLAGSTSYPTTPAEPEQETHTPDYMLVNQPTKVPTQQIDLSGNPLAENFSAENIESAVLTEFRGV